MKKIATIILILSFVIGILQPLTVLDGCVVYAAEPPAIEAAAGVVIELNTGNVLYDKNMHLQLEPASTTKIMTCILALENLELDRVVEIDKEVASTGGSRIYLSEGEQITVENLLYALMVKSANDAAVALAKAVSGNIESFAELMNSKAKEAGAENTNFVNPNGLHAEGHLTTAYDLAKIAIYAMQNTTFRKLVTTSKYTIPPTNMSEARELVNTNRLLSDADTTVVVNGVARPCRYDGCTGIKTGFTNQAGSCLVSGAKFYDAEVVAVVLKSTDMGNFADSIAILDYAFSQYHVATATKEGEICGEATIKKGDKKTVPVMIKETKKILLPAEASTAVVKTKVVLDEDTPAPIVKGQKMGVVEIYEGEKLHSTVDLLATEAVDEGTFLSYIGISNDTAYTIFIIAGIFGAIVAALVIYYNVMMIRKRKRLKYLREKRAMELAQERLEKEKDKAMRDWFFS